MSQSEDTTVELVRSSNLQSSATPSNTQEDKRMKRKLVAWDHFTRFEDENNEVKGKCNYCDQVLDAHPIIYDTSALEFHLTECEKHPYSVDLQTNSNVQEGEATLSTWKVDQKAIRDALAYMIIVDELPFKFVESLAFKKFMSTAQPMFKIPSQFMVARDCYQIYLVERNKLKQLLEQNSQRVCLTIDTWSSIQGINYICLTARFIDNNWNLHKRMLNFCPVDSHKGIDLGNVVEKCLIDWEIEKVFTITVDNASSNDVAIEYLRGVIKNWGHSILDGEFLHVKCMTHILNLVVVDGLKHVNPSVLRVRAAVRYLRQSPIRLKKFKQCIEIEKIDSKSLLHLDVATKWNSTYLMLDAAQKFERAFKRYEQIDPLYKSELDVDHGDKVFGLPDVDDWRICRKMVRMLKTFYDLSLLISSSLNAISNTYFDEIISVVCLLREWQESTNLETSLMAAKIRESFDQYWGDYKKMNKLIYVAVILDPRFKLKYVAFALNEVYGELNGEMMTNLAKESTYAMYDSYCKLLTPQSGRSSERLEVSSVNEGMDERSAKRIRLDMMLRYKKYLIECEGGEKKSELDRFFGENLENDNGNFDILKWWKNHSSRFLILSQMGRDVLTVPISNVASPHAFSTGGRTLDAFRSSLTPDIVQSLLCAQD